MKTTPLFLFFFTVSFNICFAQLNESMLDSSFGRAGKVITRKIAPGNSNGSVIRAMVLQNDGKIIAAGSVRDTNYLNSDFVLARYLNDGKLDLSFGSSGLVITDYNNEYNELLALKKQSTGKMVALGLSYPVETYITSSQLCRFNADGSLDYSFGDSGWVVLPEEAYAIAIQDNDGILVCGEIKEYNGDTLKIRRYNRNGKPDNNFGINGLAIAIAKRAQFVDARPVITVDKSSRIVAGFTAVVNESAIDDMIISRFTKNGLVDSSFNLTGKAVFNYKNGQDYLTALVIQPDNKIVFGGGSAMSTDFLIGRLNQNGLLDSSFATNGIATEDFAANIGFFSDDFVTDLAIQDDNKIVAAGVAQGGNGGRFALARLMPGGSNDSSFGLNGKTKTKFKMGDARPYAMLIQPDKKILCGGYAREDNNITGDGDFAIARYLNEEPGALIITKANDQALKASTNMLAVFPNPAHDKIYIRGLDNADAKIQIINSLGKTVYYGNVSGQGNFSININTLSKGIYYIKIEGYSNTINLKFIKL